MTRVFLGYFKIENPALFYRFMQTLLGPGNLPCDFSQMIESDKSQVMKLDCR